MKKLIDHRGNVFYFNESNKFHREDGPAMEYANGHKFWFKNGFWHREYGPAAEYTNGDKWWYKNGLRHREDGPAMEYADGNKEYYFKNKFYPNIKSNEEWIRFIKLMVFL